MGIKDLEWKEKTVKTPDKLSQTWNHCSDPGCLDKKREPEGRKWGDERETDRPDTGKAQ